MTALINKHNSHAALFPLAILGTAAGALLLICAFFDPRHAADAYLTGFNFWLGIALGSLVLTAVGGLTGGAWTEALAPFFAAATKTLPLCAAFFIPIALSVKVLYPWTTAGGAPSDVAFGFLNFPFFLIRAVCYFAVWIALAKRFQSRKKSGESVMLLSGLSLAILLFTITFAAIDWVMSLTPHWSSTDFGLIIGTGDVLSALAAAAFALLIWNDKALDEEAMRWTIAKLLITLILLWTYISYSQFIIIWSGNLPDEVSWYAQRRFSGWKWSGLSLIILNFAAPFVLLLSSGWHRRVLFSAVTLLLVMAGVEWAWLVMPSVFPSLRQGILYAALAIVALGSFWICVFIAAAAKEDSYEQRS